MEKGTVYLIPTVLSEGMYQTLSPQVASTVASLDYFLVENLRTARRFVSGLNTGQVIETLEFRKVDKDTSAAEISQLMDPVLKGRDVGIMSEAGCPGIADPGSRVVALAHQNNVKVVPLTGPSSIFLALMASGFNGQQFTFHGYLPIDDRARAAEIKKLEQLSRQDGSTHIFIETPYRNMQMMAALLSNGNPSTRLCVARDITGREEWVHTATLKEWKSASFSLHKIPCVFLLSAT